MEYDTIATVVTNRAMRARKREREVVLLSAAAFRSIPGDWIAAGVQWTTYSSELFRREHV